MSRSSSYSNSRDRPDPSYEPYVSSQYGPNNGSSMPAMLPDETKKEWRARIRAEMEMKIVIWPRSPSPPKQKSKPVPKVIDVKKESSPERSTKSKSKKSDRKSEKSERKKSEKSDRHNKSPENDAVNKKSVHFDPVNETETDRALLAPETNFDNKIEMQKAFHHALGLSEYERAEVEGFRRDVQGEKRDRDQESDEDDDIGPLPMVQPKDYAENKEMSYGGALMPGEGAAIAMYVQQNMRIPRRGEIGWSGEEINGLEDEGYVMSGSRHKKMNAVRIRKENQVYSAEEKRALALITFEEKQQKDNKVVGDFREMLTHKLIASGHIAATTEKVDEGDSE